MVKTEQKKIIKQETSSSSSSSSPKQMPSSHMSAGGESKKMRKYKGVRMRSWGSWVSEIRAPNQKTRIWLGSYSTAEAAARAYDAALLCLKGSSANLNFPITSSHYIPSDTVMSPKSIQRVAAAAANSAVNSNVNDINVLPSSTSPASFSSPSLSSSSPSDQLLEDDVSAFMQSSFGSYSELPMMMEPFSWYNNFDGIQSPKYVDQMFINGVSSFDPPLPLTIDDYLLEEGDIRLWSFC